MMYIHVYICMCIYEYIMYMDAYTYANIKVQQLYIQD